MTKHEQATVQSIIREIDAMETIPSIVGMVCRAFPDASEAKLDLLIESVYDGIEFH